jgi:hypothetical protein
MFRLDPDRTRCAWISGDPRTPAARQCAARAVAGRPFCSAHARRAYRPVEPLAETYEIVLAAHHTAPAPRPAPMADPFT